MITEFYRFANHLPTVHLSLRLLRLQKELHTKYGETDEEFTKRALEIIKLIAQGLNSSIIAERLFISKHTVDTHRKNIYRKGSFNGIRDVILFALVVGT